MLITQETKKGKYRPYLISIGIPTVLLSIGYFWMPYEKLDLFANYRIYSADDYELVWTIDGKSVFLGGDSDKKTTGTEVQLLFIDDTTVKLQIISSNGDVFCEDEMFLKSSRNNDMSFGDKIVSWLLLAIILFVGIVGGTVGPWIGKLI